MPDNHDFQSPTPQRVQRRAQAAVTLKIAGASYGEIADTLGYSSPSRALTAVETELARAATTTDKDKVREVNGRRYERLLRSLWVKASDPDHPEHLAAVRTAADIISRHSRLFGAEAPTEVVVHSPTTAELERWVASVMATGQPPVIEYDVLAISTPADQRDLGS